MSSILPEVLGDSSEFDAAWWRTMLCSALPYGAEPRGIVYVGAHVGEHVPLFAGCGLSPILCVEPNEAAFEELRGVAARHDGVDCVRAALGASDGVSPYYRIQAIPTLNSTLEPDREYWIKLAGREMVEQQVMARTEVPAARLDTLLAGRSDGNAYNVLYMNTQGSEMAVLEGAGRALERFEAVFTEVNFVRRYADCALYPEIDRRLSELGFAMTYLWRYRDGGFTHGEAIYSRAAAAVDRAG